MTVPTLEFVHRDPDADVLVVTNMWPGPKRPVYGIFVKRQVDSLRAAGIRADVLYLRGFASPLAYPIAASRLTWASVAWRTRYRLVHVHAGETALAARFFVGPPMVVSYCGDDVLGDPREDGSVPLRSRVRSAAIRAHSRLFTATITKSAAMEASLPRSTQRKNRVIPNGVDPSVFRPIDRGEARRQLGWDEEERVALFAATKPHAQQKRLALARAGCAEADRRVRRLRLHVAHGADPGEMPVLMSAADCLLITSVVEGSPNTVKEALMCNLPVVATASGDIEERLGGVRPSWLCEPDARAIADALVQCLAEPRRSNGRVQAAQLASDKVAEQILELYASIAPAIRSAPSMPVDRTRGVA